MKKLFAKLMAAVLVLTSLTFPVFAGTKMTGEEEVKYWKLVDDDLVKDTIEGGTYTLITGTSKPEEWEEGWYVVSGKVTISRPVTVSGEVNLILMDGSSLTVDASKSDKCAAICVAEETDSLSIFVQSYGKYMGKLKAAGGKYGAAIGGGVGGERGLGGLGGAAGKGGEGGDAGTAGSSGAPGIDGSDGEWFNITEPVDITKLPATGSRNPYMEIWVAGIIISDKEAELSESDYVPETSDSSSSGSAVTAAPSLIAVTVQENGNQNLGSATISEPVSKISEQNKKYVVSEGAWNLAADGSWTLKDATGNVMANRWALVPDSLGTAAIGNASWFYLGADGKMLTGWQQITGEDGVTRWYYFNTQLGSLFGACVRNGKTPDGYKVDENGAWVTE